MSVYGGGEEAFTIVTLVRLVAWSVPVLVIIVVIVSFLRWRRRKTLDRDV